MMRGLFLLLVVCSTGLLLADGTRLVRHPDYNNGRLVFTYMGDVWVFDGESPARRLTVHTASDIYPKFSPDGKWVAFTSNRYGNWDVFIIPSEGGLPRRLTFYTGTDVVVTWTPDSKFVVFRSRRDSLFDYNLFKVSIEGGLPEKLPLGIASSGSFSSDGSLFAYTRRTPSFTRKGYRGASDREIWLYSFNDESFKRMTKNDWHDNCPMIIGESLFFVTEKGGTFNIWKMPLEGGDAIAVTKHEGEGVRYPSASSDGKTIVYECNFGIWRLDVKSGEYSEIKIDLHTDYRENPIVYKKFSTVDDFSVSPDGKRVAISTHGEIFVVPLDKGRVVRITDSPARDRRPVFGPKGKRIAFISDLSGRDEVYLVNADGTGIKRITNNDRRKLEIDFSPDGKKLSVTESDFSLRIYDIETGKSRLLLKHRATRPYHICWSPDGRWIAYLKNNDDFNTDVYLISTEEKNSVEHPVTKRMPYDEWYLYFTKERLYFLSEENEEGEFALYTVPLSRQEVDPDDPEAKEKREEKKEQKTEKKEGEKKEKKTEKIKVDLEGIQDRVEKLLSVAGEMRSLAVAPDGSLAVVVRESRGKKRTNIVYSVSPDGKELKQIASGRDFSSLRFSSDSKRLFFTSGGHLYSMPKSGGSPKKVTFSVEVRIDRAAEYSQIFNECWRLMKQIFYDPNMHGVDWNAVKEKYAVLLPSVTDSEALGHIINRMLGELNASHMGMYAASPYKVETSYKSRFLGFDIVADKESGLYRVGHIYNNGPADKEWVDIEKGDYIISIDGKELKVPDNYWKILNHLINERVDVVVSSTPDGKEGRTSTIRHIDSRKFWYLRYDEWVENNRKVVDELSGGRIAYLHIPGMSGRWLERFKRELIEFRLKEGMIIDVRFNGGGNIDQELIDILERRPFGRWVSRDSIPRLRPWNGFFGKKLVMINERSFSDAEIFPRAFRDLGLGRLVGVPTGGGVIATGSYRLIDGSTIRAPYVGCYMMDGTNLENWGVKPDVYVETEPTAEKEGRDLQLERAVVELLKELPEKK